MIARRLTLGTVAWLCVLACGLVVCGASALASRGHAFGISFGGKGAGNGQFNEPSAVGVNEASGNVYVVDKGNNRVEYFSSTGTYLGQFNGSGLLLGEGKAAGSGGMPGEVPTGRFSAPEGIAVDNSCQLHKPVLTEATTPTCASFDPSNGDVYVADIGGKVVDKYSPAGEYVGQLTQTTIGSTFSQLFGVGVDTKGQIWVYKDGAGDHAKGDVAQFSNGVINEFVANKELESRGGIPLPGLSGFAVDSHDNFYTLVKSERVEGFRAVNKFSTNSGKFSTDGENLSEGLDEEQSTGVAVELSSDDVYVDNVNTLARFRSNASPGDPPVERFGAGHLTGGSGVGVNAASGTVYVADSTSDAVEVFVQEPPSKPTVESESASDVTAKSATFSAEINPRGVNTAYHFEYGPCATASSCATSAYEKSLPAPDASAGSAFVIQTVSVHLQDLEPHTLYHFRMVAHNEFGTVDGEERTFLTQTAGGTFSLPDGRAWELVSPTDKRGARIDALEPQVEVSTNPLQASVAGDALTYFAVSPTEPNPQGYVGGVQVLSKHGGDGWSSQDISSPHEAPVGLEKGIGYRLFSEDLSVGYLLPGGVHPPLLSPWTTESTPYLRRQGLCEAKTTASECYVPLLSGKEGYTDVPPGTRFGGENVRFEGATPDLTHVMFTTEQNVSLTSTPAQRGSMYEWSASKPPTERLQLVTVLPQDEGGQASEGGGVLGGVSIAGHIARGAIARAGSRVLWTNASNKQLYLRDLAKEESLRIDVMQPGVVQGETLTPFDRAVFQFATDDGSKVFFTDGERLTSDSGALALEPDLYECDVVEEAGKLACRLRDLTPLSPSGESARLRVTLLGATKDGSYMYFVANGVLGDGAERGARSGDCAENPEEKVKRTEICNLYLFHDGAIKFVATLSGMDEKDWAGDGNVRGALEQSTARMSPNGRFLAFISNKSLTGYDNRDALSGRPDEEVYIYDSQTGSLACASCNPTGARPVGMEESGTGNGIVRTDLATGTWFAGYVPSWTTERYQSRYLSDSGRLFFDSSDALVPQDINGTMDVYEYEPAGIGSCTPASVTFVTASGGCVGLISSGSWLEESAFVDASETGNDVFMLTGQKLVGQDTDTALDVYDAHVCTTQLPCVTPPVSVPACTTADACRAAPLSQPSSFGTPASATFSGAGNVTRGAPTPAVRSKSLTRPQKLARALRTCRKKERKKRVACERRARRRYGPASRRANATKKSRG